jgi:hypothetical protein
VRLSVEWGIKNLGRSDRHSWEYGIKWRVVEKEGMDGGIDYSILNWRGED